MFDDRVGNIETRRYSLPQHWTIQNKEDGTASYYLNTVTGEIRSTFPFEDVSASSLYDCESDEDSFTSTIDGSSSVFDVSYINNSEDTKVREKKSYNICIYDFFSKKNKKKIVVSKITFFIYHVKSRYYCMATNGYTGNQGNMSS